jgi:CheY-like chemotaxis protein
MGVEGTKHSVHILIIDDEPPICTLIKHILQTLRPGYEVTTFLEGETALTQFEQQPFDLVITDYQLPGLNGLEIANRVSKNWPGTPIILISGKPPPGVYEQVKTQGLVGFLKKPFSPAQLVEMVEITLSGQNQ